MAGSWDSMSGCLPQVIDLVQPAVDSVPTGTVVVHHTFIFGSDFPQGMKAALELGRDRLRRRSQRDAKRLQVRAQREMIVLVARKRVRLNTTTKCTRPLFSRQNVS